MGFEEKPSVDYLVSMGVYVVNRGGAVAGSARPAVRLRRPDARPAARAENGSNVYPHDGYWLDIGRPDDYRRRSRSSTEQGVALLRMPDTVLVTGAAGFVGRASWSASLQRRRLRRPGIAGGRDGDLPRRGPSWPRARHVVHLAGRTFVPDELERPGAVLSGQRAGDRRMCSSVCRDAQARRSSM